MIMKATIEKPKVFISYAWGNKDNQQKVLSFATSLIDAGIDVLLDKWDLKEGNDKYAYMEKCVTDSSVTNVLLLLDKTYTEKANERKGGVGDETQILSPEIYGTVDQRKILPIIFSRDEDGTIYKPAYLQATLHVDLSEADTYDENFKYLIKLLFGVEIYKKPPLGNKPLYVEEDSVIPTKKLIEYDSIKKAANPLIQKVEFKKALSSLSKNVLEINISVPSSGSFYVEFLKQYKSTIEQRDIYLKLLETSLYVDNFIEDIIDFLETTYNSIGSKHGYQDILYSFMQEIYIYTIAFLLKYKLYTEAGFILGHLYYTNTEKKLKHFSLFYNDSVMNITNAMNDRDNKNYYSGEAAFWIENLNYDFCTKDDFILADSICFNYILIGNKQDNDRIHWFPKLYVYTSMFNSSIEKFAYKLKSKHELQKIIKLFNYDGVSSFIDKYKEIEKKHDAGELNDWRYAYEFNHAPSFWDYIKSDEVGIYD